MLRGVATAIGVCVAAIAAADEMRLVTPVRVGRADAPLTLTVWAQQDAGRWEATVFDHLAMFWAQGGELVDANGRPIFGEPPHRARMLRLLQFLRETIRSGASPASVLASTDYQQIRCVSSLF